MSERVWLYCPICNSKTRIQLRLPTDLPKIAANKKSVDNLFLLEDGTYVIVDYESAYKKANKIKYLMSKARNQHLKRIALPCVPSRLSCLI